MTRKSQPEPALRSPIQFDPPSNGEFLPRRRSPLLVRAEALWRRELEDRHRRLGMSRRQFAESSCGVAAALWALNQAACSGEGGASAGPPAEACYGIQESMLEDQAQAREALSGDEFIFDVQTHVSDPLTGPFEEGEPPERALDFIKQIFVQSDTTVACISGVPGARRHGEQGVAARTQLSEIIERAWGPRLVLHANADPENGSSELDYMSSVAEAYPVSAWKVYPHDGSLLLDSEELGLPFVERARSLGITVIAAHRGISGGGGYASAGSPADVVRAAAAAPDLRFLIYHSGWEQSTDEAHPYDPEEPDPRGVDRLVRAVLENGIDSTSNVYAELGTTWYNLMRSPMEAAHVMGKLLLHLGPERIVWGTDCVFNGVPQEQIQAMRTFQIPESLREQYGYPEITPAMRARIFGLNAAEVYGVDPQVVRYAARGDEVDCLRTALATDPRAVEVPDPARYEGPRTRREFFARLLEEGEHDKLARSLLRRSG